MLCQAARGAPGPRGQCTTVWRAVPITPRVPHASPASKKSRSGHHASLALGAGAAAKGGAPRCTQAAGITAKRGARAPPEMPSSAAGRNVAATVDDTEDDKENDSADAGVPRALGEANRLRVRRGLGCNPGYPPAPPDPRGEHAPPPPPPKSAASSGPGGPWRRRC